MVDWYIIQVNPYAIKEALEEIGIKVDFTWNKQGGHVAKLSAKGKTSWFPYFGDGLGIAVYEHEE